MLKELYTAAMGMMPQQTRLEVIANNMANASTVGYKRQSVFERNLISAQSAFNNVVGDVEQDDPPIGSYIDYSRGAFEKTDNPLDLAIDNDNAFFVVEDDIGNQFLTRAGHFTLAEDGTLITTDGKKLIGEGGVINVKENFLLKPDYDVSAESVQVRITENGEVFANETQVGTVKLVTVENPDTIRQISNANFAVTDDTVTNEVPMEEAHIKQGFIENSNVNIISEMVAMIELQRLFEAGTKVIQTNDSTIDTSIKIGKYY
jgi:flagellar basal body rod protein FlgG